MTAVVMLTAAQVARIARVGKRTVIRHALHGDFPGAARGVNGTIMIPENEALEWARKRATLSPLVDAL